MNDPKDDIKDRLQKALNESSDSRYILRLYVTGMTNASMRAIQNIRHICAEHLEGRFELEIIDIYQNPEAAKQAQLLAAPTLIKELPPPLKKFIGDLSDVDRIVTGLDLIPKDSSK